MRHVPRLSKPTSMPKEVLAILDAIGNRVRTEILRHLSARQLTVADLADMTGVDRSSVLRHLRVLEDLGLVSADHPPGERLGRGRTVLWHTNRERVAEIANIWQAYATGQSHPPRAE